MPTYCGSGVGIGEAPPVSSDLPLLTVSVSIVCEEPDGNIFVLEGSLQKQSHVQTQNQYMTLHYHGKVTLKKGTKIKLIVHSETGQNYSVEDAYMTVQRQHPHD